MSAFGMDSFGTPGVVQTRFTRVAEILNQLSGGHLSVERATISEHAEPSSAIAAPTALVTVDEILVMIAPGLGSEASAEMRVQKRRVMAQLAIPPLRITGTIHVAMGSRPIDGLLNLPDRFMAMTDATIASGAFPQLARSASVLAMRRDRAHILLVADDEHPEELLADVLDERTAERWMRSDEEPPA